MVSSPILWITHQNYGKLVLYGYLVLLLQGTNA